MVYIHLYDLIHSRGWTQRQLSQETGIREAAISEMCNNRIKRIAVVHLGKMCKALHCKVEDILEYIPDEN